MPKSEISQTSMIGKKVPSLELLVTGGQNISLRILKGQYFVLYFYPKDKTPGCTLEGQDFTRLKTKFNKLGTRIFGASKDSIKSHEAFCKTCDISIDLIEDTNEELCKSFGVIQIKNLYGRKYFGIERSTFIVDENGFVVAEWRKVKVKGHAENVLEQLKKLKKQN